MQHIPKWYALQLIYGEVLSDLEKLFSDAGYCFMPIKGAYLIRTGLASSIDDRKMVDIDILVPEKQFDDVCDWFSKLENIVSSDNYWEFERSFFYTIFGNPVYIEFHRLINFPARFLLPNEMLFGRGIKVSDSCILPDPVDALLIHICHKLAHVIDGFEMQFYREIELYALQDGFLWEEFWKRAKKTGIYDFIWLVIEKLKRLICVAIDLPPAPSLYAKLLAEKKLFTESKNVYIRRLFFEVPFVRNFFELVRYNLLKRMFRWLPQV